MECGNDFFRSACLDRFSFTLGQSILCRRHNKDIWVPARYESTDIYQENCFWTVEGTSFPFAVPLSGYQWLMGTDIQPVLVGEYDLDAGDTCEAYVSENGVKEWVPCRILERVKNSDALEWWAAFKSPVSGEWDAEVIPAMHLRLEESEEDNPPRTFSVDQSYIPYCQKCIYWHQERSQGVGYWMPAWYAFQDGRDHVFFGGRRTFFWTVPETDATRKLIGTMSYRQNAYKDALNVLDDGDSEMNQYFPGFKDRFIERYGDAFCS